MTRTDSSPARFVVLCCACDKGRDKAGNWVVYPCQRKEGVAYSHAVCPECLERLYGREDWYRNYVMSLAGRRK